MWKEGANPTENSVSTWSNRISSHKSIAGGGQLVLLDGGRESEEGPICRLEREARGVVNKKNKYQASYNKARPVFPLGSGGGTGTSSGGRTAASAERWWR